MAQDEDELLRSVALQNARSILQARQRAEEELVQAKDALQARSEELAKTLAMMRATLEATSDGIQVTDSERRVTGYNQQFVKMWGLPTGALDSPDYRHPGDNDRQFDDPAKFLARIDDIYESAPAESHDLLELADGRIYERTSRIQYVDGRNMGRVWSIRDISERKRAEQVLLQHSEWLRITLSSIGDGVIATDDRGNVTFLNVVAEQLTGWSMADAGGKPLHDVFRIVNEHTRLQAENPATRVLQDGTIVSLANHTILIAKDGIERPIDDSAAPMRDETGQVIGAVLVFRDISERKQADIAQVMLPAIVESSEDAIISKNLDGIIQSWNRGAERIFGYTQEEAVGKSITLLIPPELIDEEQEILSRLRRGERIEHFETIRVSKSGRRIDISLTISPVRDQEGRIIGVSKIARDITERNRTEAERDRLLGDLLENEERYRLALDAGEMGVWDWDIAAARITWSKRVAEIYGMCLEDFDGSLDMFARHTYPEDSQRVTQAIQASLEKDAPYLIEFRIVQVNGTVRWIYTSGSIIRDASGRPIRMLGAVRDVSNRKRAVTELQEVGRRKDEFLALLAHELRNPLAPLRNGLQVMRLAAGDEKAVAEVRAMMERQLGHMVRLVDDLLDLSRIGQNKFELRRARVQLKDIIENAVETARPAIEAAGHELTLSIPADPVVLDADLTRLAQVFSNLLTNSAKYTDRGGHIWLIGEQRGSEIVLAVRDTGIGIPADALPTVFDMFSQVDRSIERTTGGLGIGLALVKGLVEMHDGTVTAESSGHGTGSTFTVRLPLVAQLSDSLAVADAEEDPVGSSSARRILIVDDNKDAARSMAIVLELKGNTVHTVFDGIEAIDVVENFRPHVILMDVGMPRMNGYEAARRIRELPWGSTSMIVAVTGWGQAGDRTQSMQAGFNAHMVKPVDLPALEKLLDELTSATRPKPEAL